MCKYILWVQHEQHTWTQDTWSRQTLLGLGSRHAASSRWSVFLTTQFLFVLFWHIHYCSLSTKCIQLLPNETKKKKIQIFHPWENFLLQTRLSKACKKIAVLPCDVWTNRSKEWADVNVKPFYKACFNHNTCFFLLLKKEKSYPSYKFTVFLRTHFLH